ncbi:hypothetical protein ABZ208_27030 [Streptomyces sp. NPDC006208]
MVRPVAVLGEETAEQVWGPVAGRSSAWREQRMDAVQAAPTA